MGSPEIALLCVTCVQFDGGCKGIRWTLLIIKNMNFNVEFAAFLATLQTVERSVEFCADQGLLGELSNF